MRRLGGCEEFLLLAGPIFMCEFSSIWPKIRSYGRSIDPKTTDNGPLTVDAFRQKLQTSTLDHLHFFRQIANPPLVSIPDRRTSRRNENHVQTPAHLPPLA
jgi:hypothetical protein